ARLLGSAPTTVDYHVARLHGASVDGTNKPQAQPAGPSHTGTRSEVARLLGAGLRHIEIARVLGMRKSTVSYHAGRLGTPLDDRCARRYDWDAVQRYYDAGHSVRDCMANLQLLCPNCHSQTDSFAGRKPSDVPQHRPDAILTPTATVRPDAPEQQTAVPAVRRRALP